MTVLVKKKRGGVIKVTTVYPNRNINSYKSSFPVVFFVFFSIRYLDRC